jgi:TRAP-type C4-dicarboxylate transport system permease small subunit
MNRLINIWFGTGKAVHTLAGVALIVMFFITLAEVTMRAVWHSLPGTFELISLVGGAVAGLAIPRTSQMKGHVNVDFAFNKLSNRGQNIMNGVTRFIAMIFFIFIAWSLFSMGIDYMAANEVSPSMRLPMFPVFFLLGGAVAIQVIQFLLEVLSAFGGRHE